jgi:1,4-dihydroxy-2-naphthoate octaprenyltransferase
LRIYNKFIISLALAFSLVNILLALFGQDDLLLYYNTISIAYLVIALFYTSANLNPKANIPIGILSALIFFGFFLTLGLKLYQIAQL